MSRNATRTSSAAPAGRARKPDPAALALQANGTDASGPGSTLPRAPQPAADQLLQQFRIILNAVKTHFQQVERRCGIGGVQVWALALIQDRPGLGVGQLAAELNVRQPTASSVVRSLTLQGLIEARREGADRRSVQLYITPQGSLLLQRAPGPSAGLLPEALGALDTGTRQQLETLLGLVIDKLGADRAAATRPLSRL